MGVLVGYVAEFINEVDGSKTCVLKALIPFEKTKTKTVLLGKCKRTGLILFKNKPA